MASSRGTGIISKLLTRKEIIDIVKVTTPKSEQIGGRILNTGLLKWALYHEKRITASKFGRALQVFNSHSRAQLTSAAEEFSKPHSYFANSACVWGITHEDDARAEYESATGRRVVLSGLWVSETGLLGASPDGLLFADEKEEREFSPSGIIEIKCPYTFRDLNIRLEAARGNEIPPYLTRDLKLRQTTDYYQQIQGQLHLTGARFCDFIVWTPHGHIVDRVDLDEDWALHCVPKLEAFWKHVFGAKLNEERAAGGIGNRKRARCGRETDAKAANKRPKEALAQHSGAEAGVGVRGSRTRSGLLYGAQSRI